MDLIDEPLAKVHFECAIDACFGTRSRSNQLARSLASVLVFHGVRHAGSAEKFWKPELSWIRPRPFADDMLSKCSSALLIIAFV